jgi:hypothetical protein
MKKKLRLTIAGCYIRFIKRNANCTNYVLSCAKIKLVAAVVENILNICFQYYEVKDVIISDKKTPERFVFSQLIVHHDTRVK